MSTSDGYRSLGGCAKISGVTIEHDHHRCDRCEAVTPVASERFGGWERIAMHTGPEVHLCEVCRDHPREWLTYDHVMVCVECARNTVDHPNLKTWHRPAGAGGFVCDEGFRAAVDFDLA